MTKIDEIRAKMNANDVCSECKTELARYTTGRHRIDRTFFCSKCYTKANDAMEKKDGK